MKNLSVLYAKAIFETTRDISRNAGEGVIQRFIVRLNENGKMHLLPKIISECVRLLLQEEDRHAVEASAAHPLPVGAAEELKKIFSRTVVRERRDPSVLGGLRVRVGDRVYDGTIRRQLERICKFANSQNY